MSLLLIDDQGELWRGDSRQLRIAFDSPYSGGEFVEYAVKNLGFVAINVFGASCQARLRPGFVTERASKTLLEWLTRSRLERMVVSTFERDWKSQLIRVADAPARLSQLMDQASQAKPDDFLSSGLTLSAISHRPLLRDIVEAWPHIVGQYEYDALLALIKGIFENRFVVVKMPSEAPHLLFHEVGEGLLFSAYETWRACAIGAPIEEQPDRHFGRWVASTYKSAASDVLPRIEAVDAIMRWPHAGRSRHRYKRVIFPFKAEGAPKFLVGGTIVDDAIDLRVARR
jgi:hypothetical protein